MIVCVWPEYLVPACVTLKVCLVGMDEGKGVMQRCCTCD